MALIHQGNRSAAKKIFNVFKKYYEAQGDNFQGLPKVWDPCTGLPHEDSNKWEGDSAFLLLALNYYKQSYGGFGRYKNLTQGLAAWLSQRADSCHQIVAEGVANMYAALAPFADDPTIQQRLPKLRDCFFSLVDYEQVLNHTVRGALVFGNTTGFKYVKNFAQSETWCVVNTKRTEAYRADKSEQFINVEISAQLLLTWKIWQSDLKPDLVVFQLCCISLFKCLQIHSG